MTPFASKTHLKYALSASLCLVLAPAVLGEAQDYRSTGQYPAGAARPDSTTPDTSKEHGEGEFRALTPQHFAWEASIGGLKEIRISEVAVEKTQNPQVKDLASRMIQDHVKANQDLMAMAQTKGLTVPPTNYFAADYIAPAVATAPVRTPAQHLTSTGVASDSSDSSSIQPSPSENESAEKAEYRKAGHRVQNEVAKEVRKLEGESGAQFDQDFLAMMSKDHAKAIKLFERASENLSDQDLKQFAKVTLPILREHARDVQSLQQKVASLPSGQVLAGDVNR